jgi:periplasmic protein TonB
MTAAACRTEIRFSPALVLSGALHGALVLAFVWYAMVAGPVVPLGTSVEVSMVELPAASQTVAASTPAVKALPTPAEAPSPEAMALPKKEKKRVQVAEAAPAPDGPAAAGPVAKAAGGPVGEATGREVAEMDRYLYELRVTLETRKTYPTLSRRLREAGEVLVEFKVKKDGSFDGVNILKQSEFARLNDAAVQLVASLGRFRPIPDGAGRAELSVKLPIRYALE